MMFLDWIATRRIKLLFDVHLRVKHCADYIEY